MFEVLLTFQRAFNNDITWLRDTGVLQKLKLDSFRPPFPIPDPKVRHDLPLTISQLGIVVIVLTIGLILSIDIFLFEFAQLFKGKNEKPLILPLKDLTPKERENITLTEVALLTKHFYGRGLAESLA